MKPKIIQIAVVIFLLTISISTQQDVSPNQPSNTTKQQLIPQDHLLIDLQKPYQQKLDSDTQFAAKYRIKITDEKVKTMKDQKWFLFVDVQTKEQFVWEKTKIQLFVISGNDTETHIKTCSSNFGLDSCFLTNNNFKYLNETIQARVSCKQHCEFTISAQISTKYKLVPNQVIQLDFQTTAYSKLFSLDTNNYDPFKKVEIILKPKGFLNFNAPISLYVSKGEIIPTKQNHDYKGIHLWDDGLGIFINYPDGLNKFTILVQGPQKNILTLETRIISHDLPIITKQNYPTFSHIDSQQTQLFKISVDKTQKTYIYLTTLTGSIDLETIRDQNQKVIDIDFTPLSRSYGELQYKFEPSFYQKNKGFLINDFLLVQIKGNKDSSFVFQSFSSNQSQSLLIPQVNRYSDLSSVSTDSYYLKLTQIKQNINDKNKESSLEIMTTTFLDGDLYTQIYLCKSDDVKKCQLTKEEKQKLQRNQSIQTQFRKTIKDLTVDSSIPGVKYYLTIIDYNQYLQTNGVYQVFVMVYLTNAKITDQLYTLQYVNLGNTYFLKEKELKKDRLSIDQIKYYTFVNNNDDVKSIKVHSTEISGEVLIQGFKQDPRYNLVDGKQIYQYHNAITFQNVKKGEQFFVMVQGIDNAYFSLYLQLIRESQSKPKQTNNTGYNQIIIQQNIDYDFIIKPLQKLVVQMHSSQTQYIIQMQSLLPLELCMTQNLSSPPFKPNCQVTQTLSKSQRTKVILDKGLVANMGILNNKDKAVQFKIKLITVVQQQNCTLAALGFLNTWKVQAPAIDLHITNTTNATNTTTPIKAKPICFKFNLNRRENLQIVAELDNMEYDNATISWQLNDKEKQYMIGGRHILWKKQLSKVCGQDLLSFCQLTLTIESNFSTSIQSIVQYLDKDLVLIDGMAHFSYIPIDSEDPKHFRYQLLNTANTTIVLQGNVGNYKFYGKIVSAKDFYAAQRTKVYPTNEQYLFSSQNPFYELYQVYLLTEDQIKKSNCTSSCMLLLSVYPSNARQQVGRFTIECTQQDRFLKQNSPMVGYLQGKSMAFYEYYNPNNGTIYIQLHNQNQVCAKILIKKGNQTRATPSSFDKISQNQNSLILQKAEQGSYSITLQSKHFGCSYTIQALSSKLNIKKLKRGVFSDKTFQINQTAYYLYQNFKNQSFKVITLNKHGQLQLKIRKISTQQLNSLLQTNQNQIQQFTSKFIYDESNIDFLHVDKNSYYFCFKCTYLIQAIATKYTETSLVVPSSKQQIPLSKDALVKDILKQNETTNFRIFTSNVARYKLYVQYGQLNVTITQNGGKKQVFTKIYNQTKQPIIQIFNTSLTAPSKVYGDFIIDFIHYSIVSIRGLANSSFYSLQLLTQNQTQKNQVKYGIPQYFFLQAKVIKCFKGTIDQDSEEFIISFEGSDRKDIQNISITAKINEKNISYKPTFGSSQMLIQLLDLKLGQPGRYQICLKSQKMLSLTFIQSARLIIFPQNTPILLSHSTNLTLGSQGTVLLQIDQCQSRSTLSISSTFNDLHASESQIAQVRRANDLIQFYHWGPVYMHLETKGARITWRNKDIYKERGVGYDKFAPTTANAYKDGQQLIVDINPIEKIGQYGKNVTDKIVDITYKVFVAKNVQQLKKSMNCENGDLLKFSKTQNSLQQKITAKFSISQLKQKYENQKYFIVGVSAIMNLLINQTSQTYRWSYPLVDVQKQVLTGQRPNITEQDGQSFDSPIWVLIGLLLLLGLSYLFYNKVWIKYMRNKRGRLSDQGSGSIKYTEFASMD